MKKLKQIILSLFLIMAKVVLAIDPLYVKPNKTLDSLYIDGYDSMLNKIRTISDASNIKAKSAEYLANTLKSCHASRDILARYSIKEGVKHGLSIDDLDSVFYDDLITQIINSTPEAILATCKKIREIYTSALLRYSISQGVSSSYTTASSFDLKVFFFAGIDNYAMVKRLVGCLWLTDNKVLKTILANTLQKIINIASNNIDTAFNQYYDDIKAKGVIFSEVAIGNARTEVTNIIKNATQKLRIKHILGHIPIEVRDKIMQFLYQEYKEHPMLTFVYSLTALHSLIYSPNVHAYQAVFHNIPYLGKWDILQELRQDLNKADIQI